MGIFVLIYHRKILKLCKAFRYYDFLSEESHCTGTAASIRHNIVDQLHFRLIYIVENGSIDFSNDFTIFYKLIQGKENYNARPQQNDS